MATKDGGPCVSFGELATRMLPYGLKQYVIKGGRDWRTRPRSPFAEQTVGDKGDRDMGEEIACFLKWETLCSNLFLFFFTI